MSLSYYKKKNLRFVITLTIMSCQVLSVIVFVLTVALVSVFAAPPCDYGVTQANQSCLLGHLIEVINKLINCPRHPTTEVPTTEVPTTEVVNTEESLSDNWSESSSEDLASLYGTTTDETTTESTTTMPVIEECAEEEFNNSSTTNKTNVCTSMPTTTEVDLCTCPASETAPENCPEPVLTNLKIPLPKEYSLKDGERSDFLYIPVLKVDDDTKPFDLVNVLKCLFMRDKH